MRTSITFFTLIYLFFCLQLSAQNWEEQALGILPDNYGVFGISIVDQNTVWAVAFDRNIGNTIPANHLIKVLKTTDGGESWQSFDVEEKPGRVSFDIQAFSADVAFITSLDFGGGAGQGVLKTEDGGESWEVKLNHISGGVWLRFFNQNDGVVINREFMATTQDGGETWHNIDFSNIPSFQSNESTIIFSGNNSCVTMGDYIWFGTDKGKVYRSKNKGLNWEAFSVTPGIGAFVKSLTFKDTLNGVAINSNAFGTTLMKTMDGGETWTYITPSPSIDVENIACVPGTEAALVAASSRSTSIANRVSAYSTDWGENWEIMHNNIALGAIVFSSPELGWMSRSIQENSGQNALFKWDSDIFVNTTEVQKADELFLYPNPFAENIAVKASTKIKECKLFSMDGKLVASYSLDALEDELDFESLEVGFYVLEFVFEDGNRTSRKICKAN